ncbi:MAG: phage tail protein [Reinekea sp.]|jgi:phage tail-like protein
MGLGSMFSSNDYPVTGFYFKVTFSATLGLADTSFKSVSGLNKKLETEEFVEGGENRYVHKLPTKLTHPNLVLKRGIGKMTSPLVIWCRSVFESDLAVAIVPMPILIHLLDETGIPVRVWNVMNAFPVSWEIAEFDAQKNEVALETVELSYTYSNRLV